MASVGLPFFNVSPPHVHQGKEHIRKKKHCAGIENHSSYWITEKQATLVPSTVKLLYRQTKKAQSER
jgi:hypothetical protein